MHYYDLQCYLIMSLKKFFLNVTLGAGSIGDRDPAQRGGDMAGSGREALLRT
jgi:hypothetical protein